MSRLHRFAVVLVLVMFGYCVPLVIAVDRYQKSGRAYVQASKAPPVTYDWLLTLEQADRRVAWKRK